MEKRGLKKGLSSLGRAQISFLFEGFVFWLPVIIVVALLIWLGIFIDNLGQDILKTFFNEKYLFTGSGFVLILFLFYVTGFLSKKIQLKERIFSKIPIVGILFIGKKGMTMGKLFSLHPCVFLYTPTTPSYGWIMEEQKTSAGTNWIYVYFPNVPIMLTGQVFTVRKETVIKLGNHSNVLLKALLYNSEIPELLIFLPWEDETAEEFEKRVKAFGLPKSAD